MAKNDKLESQFPTPFVHQTYCRCGWRPSSKMHRPHKKHINCNLAPKAKVFKWKSHFRTRSQHFSQGKSIFVSKKQSSLRFFSILAPQHEVLWVPSTHSPEWQRLKSWNHTLPPPLPDRLIIVVVVAPSSNMQCSSNKRGKNPTSRPKTFAFQWKSCLRTRSQHFS